MSVERMDKIKHFMQSETVLCVAGVLALASMCIVRPDRQYADYIDWRTLAILFSLMTVMAGLRQQGVFEKLCRTLLAGAHGRIQILLILVGLCFVSSMFITNDVALLTFVPFTFIVLGKLGEKTIRELAAPVVAMQTIAANLGSMLTPIGNPQNLYLYGKSDLSLMGFMRLMLPYSAVSLLMLALWVMIAGGWGRGGAASIEHETAEERETLQDRAVQNRRIIIMDLLLFLLCLLTVMRAVPYEITVILVLIGTLWMDRNALKGVDYSLLLTFAAFFIFIGNLGRMETFSGWIQKSLAGHEVPAAVLASQVTSNVPAALLLSGFTDQTKELIIGTNLGGLGTLIASMASLISYRQIARELPAEKGRYFRIFTVSNVLFLAVLMVTWRLGKISV